MALSFGMPFGFQELLDRKYRIMQQGADTAQFGAETARIGTVADAALASERARLLPTQVRAEVANLDARTEGQRNTNVTIIPLANSQLGLQAAQMRGIDEDTEGRRLSNVGLRRGLQRRPGSSFGLGAGTGYGLSF